MGGTRGKACREFASELKRCAAPEATSWADAWVGLEPTFQTRRSVEKWRLMAAEPGGEDAYFKSGTMLKPERAVAAEIVKKYRRHAEDGDRAYCIFDRVERKEELDPWKVVRQNLVFRWKGGDLPEFEVRFGIDPETFEYSIKPVPLAWLYDERFVRFLEEFLFEVPRKVGLTPSIAHGGAQFSFSAKTFLTGSLLADDIGERLNHPELSTWMMDWPNPDDRPFRATRARFAAFRRMLDAYWAGGFHPRALGVRTALDVFLDRGWGPAPHSVTGLAGSPDDVFRTNFAFGRAVRTQAQTVHPGYWQSAHPSEDGYRPDQIGRYSEGNLNRLQIAGEFHVKSGKTLDPDRVPEADAPLSPGMLYREASWEDRGQMGRTSARDLLEAVLLDVHAAQHLQAHPHVRIRPTLLQDQLLADSVETIRKHGGGKRLGELHQEAREKNLEASRGRLRSDWIEPEALFWAAWKQLPAGERSAIAREAVGGFIERVESAAAMDRRETKPDPDPMEWHRHRVHPELWAALRRADLKGGDPVRRELERFNADRKKYLARRPVFSQTDDRPPWE